MNQLLVVSILQSRGDLFDIGNHRFYSQWHPPGMTFSQAAKGGIVHHEIREMALHTEVEHAEDMRVSEMCHHTGFLEKSFLFVTRELGSSYFNSCLQLYKDVFTQVDLCKPSLA